MGIKCKETRMRIELWHTEDTKEETNLEDGEKLEGSVVVTPFATQEEMLRRFEQWEVENDIDILYFNHFTLTVE